MDSPKLPLTKRARKAFVAGAWAAAGAFGAALVGMGNSTGVPDTGKAWLALALSCVGIGIGAAVHTYSTTNVGQPAGGSDPA